LMSLDIQLANLVPGDLKAIVKATAAKEIRLALKEAYETDINGETIEELIIEEAQRLRDRDAGTNDESG